MTGQHRNIKNIPQYVLGDGALGTVADLVALRRVAAQEMGRAAPAVFLIDEFFEHTKAHAVQQLGISAGDAVRYIPTTEEPTTQGVDALMADLRGAGHVNPCVILGMGGGIVLDTAKAAANLYTNAGTAAEYQGWDLVRNAAVYKIGIPTISGTGAESSRTCVLTNYETGLKLGMNSDFTLYDQLVLDPALTATVERDQYFYTGMDSYIHCIESLSGSFRNPIGDALSEEVTQLCRRVFLGGDMMSSDRRELLMTASYLGGCALATSFVGVVHPMSAGLSVVLGIHHCLANCITMTAMDDFYPEATREFRVMVEAQGVQIPKAVCADLTDQQVMEMCKAASLHEKPLANALGPRFREVLSPKRMAALYRQM